MTTEGATARLGRSRDILHALEAMPDGEVGPILQMYQERRRARDIDWEAANYGWPTQEERTRTGDDQIVFSFPGIPLSRVFLDTLNILPLAEIGRVRESSTVTDDAPSIYLSHIHLPAHFLVTLRSLTMEQIVEVREWYKDYDSIRVDPVDDTIHYKIIHARMIAHLFLAWMYENPEALESPRGRGTRRPILCVQDDESGEWKPYQGIDRDRIVGEFVEYCRQD